MHNNNSLIYHRRPQSWFSRKMDHPFASIFHDSVFHDDFQPKNLGITNGIANVREDEQNYKFEIMVPGVDKKDIKIYLKKDNLVIETLRKVDEKESKNQLEISLPDDIDVNGEVQAHLNKGILTLTTPKEEKAKTREIEVLEVAS